MKFEKFINGPDHLEYIQLYCFTEIILDKRAIEEVSIIGYHTYELTDKAIEKYNDWASNGALGSENILKWFDLKKEEYTDFKTNFGSKYYPKVCMWSDRTKTLYYKQKLQASFIFENYIATLLQKNYDLNLGQYMDPKGQYDLGENALGIEIKNDTLIDRYGNIYIEYAEKSKATNYMYIHSGILKPDNCKYFLIGTEKKFWIFRKERLVEIYNEEQALKAIGVPSKRGILFKVKDTSLGFVFPVVNAEKEAISIDILINELKK